MRRILRVGASALALVASAAQAETVTMKAMLTSASEVPANASPAKGEIEATYDTTTKMLSWSGTYAGLTGPATAAHFHGPAEPGKNAGVLVPSPAATPIKGSATLTEAQAADLMAGKTYFNVHTTANPGGEIRGQVTK